MKKRITAALLLLALLCTVLSACGDGSTASGTAGQSSTSADGGAAPANEITVGIANDLDNSLDPHKTVKAGTREVMFNVFEGLMKPTSEGDLVPAVAEGYTLSEDRRTYTFTLRQGVKFHNGQTVTVQDVLWSIQRVTDGEETGVIAVDAFSGIESIEAPDENTVVITLTEPSNEFLSYLTSAILPEGYDQQDTAPVGTGPFKFVSRAAQDTVVLEKFDEYWGTPAYLDKVTYKIIENADSLMLSLQSGAIDLCPHLTSTQVAQLGDDFYVAEGTMNLVQALYLNNAEKPFDDVRVRQALCYAVDKQAIIDIAFDGYGSPLGSSMYPAFGKYFDDSLTDYYTCDVEKAKSLLAEAGYPDGFDMTITVPSNYQPHMDTAEVIVQQLAAIGVNAVIQPIEWESWVSDVYVGRQFQSTVVGVDASTMTARALLERFTSTYGKNFINYSSETYDELFRQVLATADDAVQTDLYKQMEADLTANAANVYIQDMADLVAVRKGIEGVTFYPIYVLDVSTIYYS
jgi:peptide/nickel transport system substrate-binding protein